MNPHSASNLNLNSHSKRNKKKNRGTETIKVMIILQYRKNEKRGETACMCLRFITCTNIRNGIL